MLVEAAALQLQQREHAMEAAASQYEMVLQARVQENKKCSNGRETLRRTLRVMRKITLNDAKNKCSNMHNGTMSVCKMNDTKLSDIESVMSSTVKHLRSKMKCIVELKVL